MTDHDLKDLTIRVATPGDAPVVQYLAQIDSAPLVTGRVLLAELDGMPYAAISLDTGAVVADPFRPTAEAFLERMANVMRLPAPEFDTAKLPREAPLTIVPAAP